MSAAAEKYEVTIGLEIHVQLATQTKMFCGCRTSFGDDPNTHTCPRCLGLPGALPLPNAKAVHYGLMMGLALGSEIAPRSIFHRKNYFYPDLPKGYQISQFDEPLCDGGELGGVRLNRVHLEEDAAKLNHAGGTGRISGSEASVVDFNRGGTPLAEIVTEPDITSAEQASEWLRLLRVTIRQLGVSDVNMEEGSLRCDANISIRPKGQAELGTKTELKNMNSFRFIERGIKAEVARQIAIVEGGGQVVGETLHFDPRTEAITSMRSKEEAHDYRYFPEPDLVPVIITPEMIEAAKAELPELPLQREQRFIDLGVEPAPPARSAGAPSWVISSRRPWPPTAPSRRPSPRSSPTSCSSASATARSRIRRPRPTRSPSSSPSSPLAPSRAPAPAPCSIVCTRAGETRPRSSRPRASPPWVAVTSSPRSSRLRSTPTPTSPRS